MAADVNRTVWLALIAALMWGVWWVPVRGLEAIGLNGVWAGVAMCAGAVPALLFLALQPGETRLSAYATVGALLAGIAVTLYSSALVFTDVVRAVLLFYLAPAWSTIIECLFFGRRWSARSALALGLSFVGVATMFRWRIDFSDWGAGDLMALASGLLWSIGAAIVFSSPGGAGRLAIWSALGAIGAGVALGVVGGAAVGAPPTWDVAVSGAPWALLAGLAFFTPLWFLTLWAAKRLPPATMSFLLTGEILSGVVSSAIFLDEPFWWPEILGAILIALGATVEIIRPPKGRRV